MTAAETAPERTEEIWTCIGRRWNYKTAQIRNAFLGADGNEQWWEPKSFPFAKPGQRIKITRVPDGIYTKGVHAPKYRDTLSREDEPRITDWITDDALAYAAQLAAQRAKKAETYDISDLTLSELRIKLRGQFGSNRARLMGAIMDYLL